MVVKAAKIDDKTIVYQSRQDGVRFTSPVTALTTSQVADIAEIVGLLPQQEVDQDDLLTLNFRALADKHKPDWIVIKSDHDGEVYAHELPPQKTDIEWCGDDSHAFIGNVSTEIFDWHTWEIRR